MRSLTLACCDVQIFPDAGALSQAAAEEIARSIQAAASRPNRFLIALAGGSTPKTIYSRLARTAPGLPWERVGVFFGDERDVPLDHEQSNYRMAREAFAPLAQLPAEAWHPVRTELGAARAAAAYEQELRAVSGTPAGAVPRLDLILLGMGPDGHTASLFPGSPGLEEQSALVCANRVENLQTQRITFTLPLLNAAAEVLFFVSGEGKAGMLRRVLQGARDEQGRPYPAQLIRPASGRLIWLVDEAAAKELDPLAH